MTAQSCRHAPQMPTNRLLRELMISAYVYPKMAHTAKYSHMAPYDSTDNLNISAERKGVIQTRTAGTNA